MDATCMDPATARLAVQLQLADIDDLLDNLYDDEDLPEGDTRTSFQMMRIDLQKQLQILEGQVLTLKILRDEHDSRLAFARLIEEERQAVDDHQLAMQLSGIAIEDPAVKRCNDYEATLTSEPDCDDDAQWDMAKELYASAFEPEDFKLSPALPQRIRSTRAKKERARSKSRSRAEKERSKSKSRVLGSSSLTKCVVCMEVVQRSKTITLACKPETHTYCRGCLVDLFQSSLDDNSTFPPRCCKVPVPLHVCRAIIPRELTKKFDLKVEELATPNPTYCSNAECSKFIRPKEIKAGAATCVYCKDRTCVRCKCAEHKDLCPNDPHVQLLMDAAKRSKWQQCTKCRNMVELAHGCFHMTCRCKHQFCYLCGGKWKTCRCPTSEEGYITGTIELPTPAPNLVVRTASDEAVDPMHAHDWQRESMFRLSECDECHFDRLDFVMRCSICSVANCWRCIHNRG